MISACSSTLETLTSDKAVIVVHDRNPSTEELETGASDVHADPWLTLELEINLE